MKEKKIHSRLPQSTPESTRAPKTTVTAGPIKLPEPLKIFSENPADPVTIVFGSERLGEGSPDLGRELIKNFLLALDDLPKPPEAVILYNSAVKLALADSPVLAVFKSLQHKGTEILVCQTSLRTYNFEGRAAVGELRTMNLLVERMMRAHHILWPK